MRWVLGIIVVIIIALIVWYVVGAGGGGVPGTATTTPATTQAADILPGVPNDTYSNPELGFSIEYPSTASTSADFSTGYLPLTQTPVMAFELPQAMFSGTNLVEAGVYVGATTTPSIVSACTEPSQAANETATSGALIEGQPFSVFTSTGAGAGNIYQEKTFRTVQNGACLEIVELLHSGDIGNYPSGTVAQFDPSQYQGILDAIVYTYQPAAGGS